MSLEVALIVLAAAALNAGWNALVKVSGDKVASMAAMTLMGAVASAAVLPFVELPDPASWPLLGLAILLHTAYHFALPIAYRHGDLGQVYPISRGSAPLLVTLGAAAFAGETLASPVLLGVPSCRRASWHWPSNALAAKPPPVRPSRWRCSPALSLRPIPWSMGLA